MPLDLQGFYTPPQEFNAFDKVENTMERTRLRQMQIAQQQQTRKAAASRYLSNYINSKDKLTGTNYDPEIIKLTSNAMQQGMDLASKGADVSDIQMAINPLVSQINDYQSKAKMFQQNKKQALDYAKQNGFDVDKYGKLLDDLTFYQTDPKTGAKMLDIDNADPTLQKAHDLIEQNHLADITSNAPLTKAALSLPDVEDKATIKTKDLRGRTIYKQQDYKAPNWVMPEAGDNGKPNWVPKYDLAVDQTNGQVLHHPEVQPDGSTIDKPIRLATEPVFKWYLNQNPGVAKYLQGQVQQHIADYKDEKGNPIPINSPKAEMIARALLYHELEPLASGKLINNTQNLASPQEIRLNFTGNAYAPKSSGGSGSGTEINDVVGSIAKKVDTQIAQNGKGAWQQFDTLDGQEKALVSDAIKNSRAKDAGDLQDRDIQVQYTPDGRLAVYRSNSERNVKRKVANTLITIIGDRDNIKYQTNGKAKNAQVSKINSGSDTQPAETPNQFTYPNGKKKF